MKVPGRTAILVAGLSDAGQKRANNEDCIWFGQRTESDCLLIVADGVGGAAAGELASREAVQTCRNLLYGKTKPQQILQDLRSAIEAANRRVTELAESDLHLHGMASTLTVAVIAEKQLYVGHVGDSRCYLIRDAESRQLSTDHTWVAEAVEEGYLTDEEAAVHPARHTIRRGIGIEESIKVDTYGPFELLEGDCVLLCSDGLSDVVQDNEIAGAASSAEPQDAVERLVALANQRGGPDNVSVVIARIGSPPGVLPATDGSAAPIGAPQSSTDHGDAAVAVTPRKKRGQETIRSLLVPVLLPISVLVAVGIGAGMLLFSGGANGSQASVSQSQPAGTQAVALPIGSPSATLRPAEPPAESPSKRRVADATCEDGSAASTQTVVSGETSGGIADRYDLTVDDLTACDSSFQDPDNISIDQQVKVPCGTDGCH